jgi:hypothetical protein
MPRIPLTRNSFHTPLGRRDSDEKYVLGLSGEFLGFKSGKSQFFKLKKMMANGVKIRNY